MASDSGSPNVIRVTVCAARPGVVWQRDVTLPAGSAVEQALRASGYAGDPWEHGAAVYGKRARPDTVLRDNDRIDILRPLVFDPKESRRRRAAHKKAK